MMVKRVPLTPLSPLSQSLTWKVTSTLPIASPSSILTEDGRLMNSGGQSLKSCTTMFTTAWPEWMSSGGGVSVSGGGCVSRWGGSCVMFAGVA